MIWTVITFIAVTALVLLVRGAIREASYYHRAFLEITKLFPPEIAVAILEKYPVPGFLPGVLGLGRLEPNKDIKIGVSFERPPPDKPDGIIYH